MPQCCIQLVKNSSPRKIHVFLAKCVLQKVHIYLLFLIWSENPEIFLRVLLSKILLAHINLVIWKSNMTNFNYLPLSVEDDRAKHLILGWKKNTQANTSQALEAVISLIFSLHTVYKRCGLSAWPMNLGRFHLYCVFATLLKSEGTYPWTHHHNMSNIWIQGNW